MGDLVNLERVGNHKSKKAKLDVYTPSDPIKTTHELDSSNKSDNFSKQQNDSPCSNKKQGVTAVIAVMMAENKPCHIPHKKASQNPARYSSDGIYCSMKKEQTNIFPT
jgi:hypothetical protein